MRGLAIDPQVATNRFVYTFQSFRAATGAMDHRVVRWTADAGWTTLGNRTDIVLRVTRDGAGASGNGTFPRPAATVVGIR